MVKLPDKNKKLPLSGREFDVLELVADGLTDRKIADRLGIREHTVKTHLRRINAKLGATNRAHAVAIGLRKRHIR